VIHSLTANIGQFKHCNSLVNFFLWRANVFTLDSNERYFRSRNLALSQDSHSLRGSTRDMWTVLIMNCACGTAFTCRSWRDSWLLRLVYANWQRDRSVNWRAVLVPQCVCSVLKWHWRRTCSALVSLSASRPFGALYKLHAWLGSTEPPFHIDSPSHYGDCDGIFSSKSKLVSWVAQAV
jgi:hypothetical protein